jgi:hypothetical protein
MITVSDFKFGDVPSEAEGIRRGILTFGKLAGLTYELALANDSEYCQWTMDNYSVGGLNDEAMLKFVDWLSAKDRLKLKRKAEEIAESDDEETFEQRSARFVDFGKYADSDITYGELVDKQPGYCLKLLELQDGKIVSAKVRAFLNYIKESDVELLNAKLRHARQQQRTASARAATEHASGLLVPPKGLNYSG